ncbi:MAG TPA: DUF1552 domain-containing protein [Polyangiaceae bacterium]|nr:DUF1552 domain-containing protein [Polyangiaceae bacterium]
MKHRLLNRRQLLATFGAAGALSPFVPLLQHEADAADAEPTRRVIFFFTPLGLYEPKFWPTGTETNFQMGQILDPLAPHQKDLMILKGVDLSSYFAQVADNAKFHITNDHPPVIGHILTADYTIDPKDGSNPATSNAWEASNVSIDQFLGKKLGQGTRYQDLVLGAGDNGFYLPKISYTGAKQGVKADGDANGAFARIFIGVQGTGSQVDPQLAQRLAERKSVLDYVQGDLNGLLATVATEDKQKIRDHLERLRAMEQRVTSAPQVAACVVPKTNDNPKPGAHDPTSVQQLISAQIENLALSFSCDLARVGFLQIGHGAGSDIAFGFDEHDMSHSGNPVEGLVKIHTFYAQQFAHLIERLKAVPEGPGTLFDNTVLVWVPEMANNGPGRAHNRNNVPFLLAGSCGGRLNTGRFLSYDKASHTDLYITVCHALGLTDVNDFGHPGIAKGPLAGLLT